MRWTSSHKTSTCASLVLAVLVAYVSAEYVDPVILDACPGYNATNVQVRPNGLTADLVLGEEPCNIFGKDIQKLALSVVYETGRFDRVHLKLTEILNIVFSLLKSNVYM